MKIAMVDDDASQRAALRSAVRSYAEGAHIPVEVAEFETGAQLMEYASGAEFDVIFLDVYIGEENGMELARALRRHGNTSLLVFITVSAQHAVESYEVDAFYYLVKPLEKSALFRVLDKCAAALYDKKLHIQLKEGWSYVNIPLDDILFVDMYNHYVLVHTKAKINRSHMPFQEIRETLLKYPQFACCYRNCIINMDRVVEMERNEFLLASGDRIPISRSMRLAIHQQYADYQFNHLHDGISGG